MALDLEPADVGLLQERIRAAFSGTHPQEELRTFVETKLAFDIYDELGGVDTPIKVFASKLITKTTKDGTSDTLVRALYVERKGDAELRELVRRILPDALVLVSEQEFESERIRSALDGVTGLERLRADPRIARKLDEARFNLEATATDLAELVAYKGMHDALHTLQLKLYGQILDQLRRFPKDEESVAALREYLQQLTMIHAEAADAADVLPDEILRAPECHWIGRFEQTCAKLRLAVDTADGPLANSAKMELRQLLRAQPTRLNAFLVQTARRIPWKVLIETMTAVAGGLSEDDADRQLLADASTALQSLMNEVLARIDEHELWQYVDVNFWQTEEALQKDDQTAADEISAMWPIICEQVRLIREKAPGDWSADLDRFADEFAHVCPIPATPPLDQRARPAFQRMVHSGRVRFFMVDRDIKARCQGISKLSEPLRKLVGK